MEDSALVLVDTMGLDALCRDRGYHSVWEGDGGHCDDCGTFVATDAVGNVPIIVPLN